GGVDHGVNLRPRDPPSRIVLRGLPHADDEHMRALVALRDRASDERRRVAGGGPVESERHESAVLRELHPVRVTTRRPHAPSEPCVRGASPLPEPVAPESRLSCRLEGRLYGVLVEKVT